ncbi:MAG: prepilin-type N-terminal cleavage/methylation domain-containing protein [Candidatus Accumulibacter sp.]|nr:prepilin-type N-terminal cleavage/methylation domain-containing protein [Accumulibacter sp.]
MSKDKLNGSFGARGFTLVEMSVVLVVIGVILGAISIGKDVQRNAEYARIKQKFIDQWALSYNVYVQRTGYPPGDSQQQPRWMVGGAYYTGSGGVISGGANDGALPGSICHNQASTLAVNLRAPIEPNGLGPFDLRELMLKAGVRMPPGRAEGLEDRYVYLDTNGNPQEIQVCFQWNRPGSTVSPEGSGNVMVIAGLTPDLARALDQMIDGKADALEGVFRQAGVANGVGNVAGVEWSANNTVAMGGGLPGGQVLGATLDEDQVATVTAVYKMNQ